MYKGYRFKLVREVDRLPQFIAPAGLTGTVIMVVFGIWAKTDQRIPGSANCDNMLHWYSRADFLEDTAPHHD
jgi:hypothetical protein